MKREIYMAAIAAISLTGCNSGPKLGEASVDDVIAAMTLEEKVRLVVGTDMEGVENGDRPRIFR